MSERLGPAPLAAALAPPADTVCLHGDGAVVWMPAAAAALGSPLLAEVLDAHHSAEPLHVRHLPATERVLKIVAGFCESYARTLGQGGALPQRLRQVQTQPAARVATLMQQVAEQCWVSPHPMELTLWVYQLRSYDDDTLRALARAADVLDVRVLLDLVKRELARRIVERGMSPSALRVFLGWQAPTPAQQAVVQQEAPWLADAGGAGGAAATDFECGGGLCK